MENNRFLANISASTIKNFFPKSVSTKQKMMKSVLRKPKSNSENIPPIDSNILISDPPLLPSSSFPRKSASKAIVVHKEVARSEAQTEVPPPASDSAVKVLFYFFYSSLISFSFNLIFVIINFLWFCLFLYACV